MSDMNCPYCNAEQDVDHDDGEGYDESQKHEHECSECGKNFTFRTTTTYRYEPAKADCLNDGNHQWYPSKTYPKHHTRMLCRTCDDFRDPTLEEKAEHGIPERPWKAGRTTASAAQAAQGGEASKHTQGTLAERNGRIYCADRENLTIANIARSSVDDYSTSNARRLVACWNACIGISTENLEDNIPILELANRYNDSIKQRNELLDALKEVTEILDAILGFSSEPSHGSIAAKARAAIAAAKENT